MVEKYNEILSGEYANISKELAGDAKKVLRHGEYQLITKITEPMALKKKSLALYHTDSLTEKSKRKYINMLRSIKDADVIQAAKTIWSQYPHDTELVKTANNKLLKKFKKKSNTSNHVDAISWLCNILGNSEDVQFISTLNKVEQETETAPVWERTPAY